MDLKTLELELLERIALLEDEARLLALKRLLDGPPTYTVPSDHLSVVREGVEAVSDELSPEEGAALDASRERFLKGEGQWLTRAELEARMNARDGK